jgi:hypothetical protein
VKAFERVSGLVLWESVARLIRGHRRRHCGLKMDGVPQDFDRFQSCLNELICSVTSMLKELAVKRMVLSRNLDTRRGSSFSDHHVDSEEKGGVGV